MGAAGSTSFLVGHQDLLENFVGPISIAFSDPFWSDLLSFSHPLTKFNPIDLDEATRESCSKLALNNRQTGHFAKLLVHLQRVLKEVPTAIQKQPVQAINAVYFTRLFVKHLVEYYDGREIWDHMLLTLSDEEAAQAPGLCAGQQNVMTATVQTLLSFLGLFDMNVHTYLLHLEVTNLLLVMAATQLQGLSSSSSHIFLDAMMAERALAGPVVRKLLLAYMARLPLPPRAPYYVEIPGGTPKGMLRKVGSAAAAVFLLPYYTYAYLVNARGGGVVKSPLAEGSLLLLLVLVHYGKVVPPDQAGTDVEQVEESLADAEVPPPQHSYAQNPFRIALQTARDKDFGIASPRAAEGEEATVLVPFAALFDTLGSCLKDDRSTLLLYSLVHGNSSFLDYLLVRADLDTVLVPLLEMLYHTSSRTPNQIYMLLIILLILSQDSSFNANVHKLILPGVSWYKERLLPKISLGSLMVVILIRTIKYNLSKLRDVYLHTNCLAALANMAPHVHHLNAYASQRLISLFHMLARKYMRLSEGSNGSANAAPAGELEATADVPSELHIYTDFLRIVLEIVNAILTYALPRNPEVVYALLHRQELFQPFRHHPRFNELLENIFTVVEFFNVRVDGAERDGDWSVEKVLDLIIVHTRFWRGDGIKMFTELRFTYEEELHPEDFFIPYIWSLAFAHSSVPWNPDCISLFPARPVAQLEDIFDTDAFDTSSEYPPTPREQV